MTSIMEWLHLTKLKKTVVNSPKIENMKLGENGITFNEALSFVKNTLCISQPQKKLQNKEMFMCEFLKCWAHHIPFQTITAVATPLESRGVPSIQELKRDISAKIGGICYQTNVCCYLVLGALEFEVNLIPCDIDATLPDMHTALIVHNLTKKGSKHLLDVGTGFPSFQAVPLDFIDESPELQESFLRYKFIRQGSTIVRLHRVFDDDNNNNDNTSSREIFPGREKDGWYTFVVMHVRRPVPIQFFAPQMQRIFTEHIPRLPLLSSLRCMAWPNGRFVCIKDEKLMLEVEDGRVETKALTTFDEKVEVFEKYFPQIPRQMLIAAWMNLHLENNVLA